MKVTGDLRSASMSHVSSAQVAHPRRPATVATRSPSPIHARRKTPPMKALEDDVRHGPGEEDQREPPRDVPQLSHLRMSAPARTASGRGILIGSRGSPGGRGPVRRLMAIEPWTSARRGRRWPRWRAGGRRPPAGPRQSRGHRSSGRPAASVGSGRMRDSLREGKGTTTGRGDTRRHDLAPGWRDRQGSGRAATASRTDVREPSPSRAALPQRPARASVHGRRRLRTGAPLGSPARTVFAPPRHLAS